MTELMCKVITHIRSSYEKQLFKIQASKCNSLGNDTFMDYPFTLRGGQYITLGKNVHFCRGCRLQAWDYYEDVRYSPQIVIGDNVSINMDVDISAIDEIRIGNGVLIASNVLITDHFHGNISKEENAKLPAKRSLHSKGPVIIGDNVWIGFNVSVLPGVTIGEGAIIGAGAVITKDVEPFSVVVGSNRFIKSLK